MIDGKLSNSLVKSSNKLINFGNFIGDLFILQVYFILYSLRGGVILGVFPSFLSLVRVISTFFYDDSPDEPTYVFKKTYKEVFKTANIVGWIFVSFVGLLIFDYNFNKQVLGNSMLRVVLIVLLIFALITLSHLPIVVLRMELSIKDYFKQGLILALSSPFEMLSIILALVLIEYIFMKIPLLILALGGPILAMPFAWFAYHSLEKIIKKREVE